jgi:uncharacterized protein YyaL (SSP411 family)
MPAFRDVLDAITNAWTARRHDVIQQGQQISKIIEDAVPRVVATVGWQDADDGDRAMSALTRAFDPRWGGFGGAPKFPQATVLEWLLRRAARGDDRARTIATGTLDHMAHGGIHDQIGGGFFRYSTDAAWLVPHFEKMLYDNAQLLQLYTRAWLLTRLPVYRDTAERTANFLLGEMRSPEGGFISSLDADTEGVEGRTYTWPWEELVDVIGVPAATSFGATPTGNWEGTNVLWLPDGPEHGVDLDEARGHLLEARSTRQRPSADDKIVVAWNGLAIRALCIAGLAFARKDLIDAAVVSAGFVDTHLRGENGRLFRSFGAGRADVPGFCDDYAMLGLGLLALFEATGDARWFTAARTTADDAVALFEDPIGGFFMAAADANTPLVRPKEVVDQPLPSSNAAMCELLARLGLLTGDAAYRARAEKTASVLSEQAKRLPLASGHALCALDLLAGPASEVAIVGDPGRERDALLAEVTQRRYVPNVVVAVGDPSSIGADAPVPLLRDRPTVNGRATAYVCEGFVCRTPVTDPGALAASLSSGGARGT